jgi:glycine dehydrogenase
MAYPADLRYSKDHEWVRMTGDVAGIGITDYAQQQLGDVVYVDLPAVGTAVATGAVFGTIESVKAVSELFRPGQRHHHRGEPRPEGPSGVRELGAARDVDGEGARHRSGRGRRGPDGRRAIRSQPQLMGDRTTALGEFARRHIGPSPADQARMLEAVGVPSLDALIDEVVPEQIRSHAPVDIPGPDTEEACLRRLAGLAARNRVWRTYIGLGYADTITPSVILRMVMENPGWYTPYTPYQAEIAQGRLESLINFQTMVSDLTGMEVANASLLDEGTAAAEAMALLHRVQLATPGAAGTARHRFLVSDGVHGQTIDVLRSRAEPLDIEIAVAPLDRFEVDAGTFGVLLQYPDDRGRVVDLRPHIERARAAGAGVAVATDLLALTLLTPPGEMGADVVVGNSQRFGVPLGYGGPHAAFFATRQAYVRHAPGRIIGASVDVHGRTAFRMALATREQHIRREKATSNICTAQALLANMAAMYAVYHGPDGLRAIASRIHGQARTLEVAVTQAGLRQLNDVFFDTLLMEIPTGVAAVRGRAESAAINLRYVDDRHVAIALHERVTDEDVADLVEVLTGARPAALPALGPDADGQPGGIPAGLTRTSAYLTHPTFNSHKSETQMMRYIRHLERKDLGLDTAMIPLGSCTMKLNAATEMLPVTWEGFSRLHPFVPVEQAQGYAALIEELEASLCAITGFAAVSLQPNSGAQGEFTGLLVVRAYHRSRGQAQRDVVLIPASAHGTNPASAAMAGMTGGGGGQRARWRRRHGGPRGQGHQARRPPGVPDDHVSVHARRL